MEDGDISEAAGRLPENPGGYGGSRRLQATKNDAPLSKHKKNVNDFGKSDQQIRYITN
jgi:hypothetical protein